MIEQKIKEASAHAKKVKTELKEMNGQYTQLQQRKGQIPNDKKTLNVELTKVGTGSSSLADVEKNTNDIYAKLALLEKERALVVQKIVFINGQIAAKRAEVDVALKGLNAVRAEFIEGLEAALLSRVEFVNKLVELKGAHYTHAASNGARMVDDRAWLWGIADSIKDSDELNDKMLKIFCVFP